MQSCLGIYIQDNLIKYSKIAKDHNNLKVEAYGVKFYEADIEKAIEQIVKETFSFQTPISVNINKEKYTYSNIFNLLKAQDLEKAIDTEFEFFCNNNNKNKNTIEYRKIKAPNTEDRDKVRVIYTYVDKTNLVEKMQLLDKYKVSNLSPVAVVIPNVNKSILQENSIIVNIEKNTEVTTILNGAIYKVDKIDLGMNNILNSIAEKENSIKRAYEICKNTTVYTKSGQNLKIDGNEYSDEVISSLVEIIEKVREVIFQNQVEVNSIYITGMGLIINNIDLLFQEAFIDKKCEILVPSFVEKTNIKINIKDYIEVNSAIALAMQGLETKNKEVNFSTKKNAISSISQLLKSDAKSIKGANKKTKQEKKTFKDVMKADLDFTDKMLLRGATTLLLIMILYFGISEIIAKQTNIKINDVTKRIEDTREKIAQVDEYTSLIDVRTNEYQKLVASIDEANAQISENFSSKNAIPNLLNKIMYNIPKGVQLLSIENKLGKGITITAQAEKYDQLGYFKAVLEEEGILTNITTTKGTKQGDSISITITGELPY